MVTHKHLMRTLIGVGALSTLASLVFFFAAIWTHGSDAFRLAGTGCVLFPVGIILMFIGGMGSVE